MLAMFKRTSPIHGDYMTSMQGVAWSLSSPAFLPPTHKTQPDGLLLSFYKKRGYCKKMGDLHLWKTVWWRTTILALLQTTAWVVTIASQGKGIVLAGSILTEATRSESTSRFFDKETKTSEVAFSRAHMRHHLSWGLEKQLKSLGMRVGWGLKPTEA